MRSVSDSAPIEPLRRAPLYEGVAERIREYVVAQDLQPGDRLPPERDLAQQLGVSRTVVRQGLTLLRVTGLVEIRHGHGIHLARRVGEVVPPISADVAMNHPDLPALGEVRNALEAQAARLAATRRTPEDLAQISEAIASLRADVEAERDCTESDVAFHGAVVRAAHNQVLRDTLGNLEGPARQIAAASIGRPGQPPRSLADHEAILVAIEQGDPAAANQLMFDHLERTGALDLPS